MKQTDLDIFEDYGSLFEKIVERISKKTGLTKNATKIIFEYLEKNEKEFTEKLESSLAKRITNRTRS